ncbi:MAG: hypothetical protein AVDCRST_MAG05-5081 [uncultured Rubrobacteraceae bacterium]|uniref:Uncharacterized protein n=1 Tax=uncultured Rubrobacteraceae bacterium TaxID=349277 RepID=A0A6J4U4Q0_9ACTN|nr:MAG: hypothetical protein AVDCRST_MAG05-5081 [uncultured Rubrobacteraceae bacterium]
MRPLLGREQTTGARSGSGGKGASRAGQRLRSAVESGVLAGLLLAVAASVVVGAPAVFLCAVVGAWLALTAIVGPRNVLDAGCYFMLLVVGVVLVVDLATNGPASLLP